MRFIIYRTSGDWEFNPDNPPCPGAFKGKKIAWDLRTFKSSEDHDKKFPGLPPWLSEGTQHGTWSHKGERGIKRRLGDETCWFIEISSLDDLVSLVDKEGRVIVDSEYGSDPHLEIYDDYRE